MNRYKDRNKRSGIAAYEIGTDWLKVRFKDKKEYEYNYVNPGQMHVERMKKLAEMGCGLNSYINIFIRPDNGVNEMLTYKGFTGGEIDYDPDGRIFVGNLIGLEHALITFQGRTKKEIVTSLQGSVESYLQMCEMDLVNPEIPVKGGENDHLV